MLVWGFFFAAVAWELLRWVSAVRSALGTDPNSRAAPRCSCHQCRSNGLVAEAGDAASCPCPFEPWLRGIRSLCWGVASVPFEELLPAGLGLASLAASALLCWCLQPGSRVQRLAVLGKGLGTQQRCLGRSQGRRGTRRAARQWRPAWCAWRVVQSPACC